MSNTIREEIDEDEAREWDTQSAMPAMWEIVHSCERAGLKVQNIGAIFNWYVFLKKNNAVTLEEFLQKLSESAEEKDFHKFSKYCFDLYRKVHEKQLTEETDPLSKNLIKEWMEDAMEMEQYGDEIHENPQDNYWQMKAHIAAPDERELPRSHVRLMESYENFENFLVAHKEFDKHGTKPEQTETSRNGIAHKVHHTLNQEI